MSSGRDILAVYLRGGERELSIGVDWETVRVRVRVRFGE